MVDWPAYVRRRLSLPALEREREAEIVEELARQLDEAYREALRAGASDAEARQQAEQHVANWDALEREIQREATGRRPIGERWHESVDDRAIARGRTSWIAQLRQDLFYAWRVMRQSRGVTVIAIVSLALGIGANTAMFSVINGLLFRRLPVPHPEQLVAVSNPQSAGMMTGIENGERSLFSYHEFENLRDRNWAFDNIAAFKGDPIPAPFSIGAVEDDRRAGVTMVSGSFFPMLGVEPTSGRLFGREVDAARMASPVMVISDAFWRSHLQADPAAVGRTIRLRRTTFTIVAVLPPNFTGLVVGSAPDIFVPLTMQEAVFPGSDWLTQPPGVARRVMFLHIVGRLKSGVSLSQANTSLNAVFKQTLEDDGALIADANRRRELVDTFLVARAVPRGLSPLRSQYKTPLVVIMGLVAVLLLLACANVANLLLGRATSRRRELALREALGASRARLIRQLLSESVLLASVGAVLGAWISRFGVAALLTLVSDDATPVPLDTHLDAVVLAFTIATTLITAVLFGLAPALRGTRLDLTTVLRGAAANVAGSGRGVGRWALGKTLAGVQVALSLALVVTAGLFVRSLHNLAAVPIGYDTTHLLTFGISPASLGYTAETVGALYDGLTERFSAIPGVRAVALSQNGLFAGSDSGDELSFPDQSIPPGTEMDARFDFVGPHYFSAVGIPVLSGRDIASQDATGANGCWIGQKMQQRFFPATNPIGHRMIIHYSFGDHECDIKGVVADVRVNSVRGELPARFYTNYFGAPTKPTSAYFILRTTGDPDATIGDVRRILRDTNPALAAVVFRRASDLVDAQLVTDRLTAQLSTLFGVLAVIMAALGLYGVMSYSVSRRVNEIGVRMALGAGRARVLRLVVGEAMAVAGLGAVAGLAIAVGATRLLGTLLFNLSPRDPAILAVSLILLLVISTAAATVPAWRASRTDPLTALRTE